MHKIDYLKIKLEQIKQDNFLRMENYSPNISVNYGFTKERKIEKEIKELEDSYEFIERES